MSMLSNYANSAATRAFSIIGAETLIIGAVTISCVFSEASDEKDYSDGGYEKMKTLTAVCKTSDMPAGSILEKLATARGVTYRVQSISKGVSFTTITLETETKS
jgi:hypothetical protein